MPATPKISPEMNSLLKLDLRTPASAGRCITRERLRPFDLYTCVGLGIAIGLPTSFWTLAIWLIALSLGVDIDGFALLLCGMGIGVFSGLSFAMVKYCLAS